MKELILAKAGSRAAIKQLIHLGLTEKEDVSLMAGMVLVKLGTKKVIEQVAEEMEKNPEKAHGCSGILTSVYGEHPENRPLIKEKLQNWINSAEPLLQEVAREILEEIRKDSEFNKPPC